MGGQAIWLADPTYRSLGVQATVTTGSSCHGHAGVSFLIATVGSTFTSPTVVLVNARVFCDDARAVLLAQINS